MAASRRAAVRREVGRRQWPLGLLAWIAAWFAFAPVVGQVEVSVPVVERSSSAAPDRAGAEPSATARDPGEGALLAAVAGRLEPGGVEGGEGLVPASLEAGTRRAVTGELGSPALSVPRAEAIRGATASRALEPRAGVVAARSPRFDWRGFSQQQVLALPATPRRPVGEELEAAVRGLSAARSESESSTSTGVVGRALTLLQREAGRSDSTAWVRVEILEPPRDEAALRDALRAAGGPRPWFLCQGVAIDFFEPPPGVAHAELSPFRTDEPEDAAFARAVKTIASRKLFREVRRLSKKEWRSLFKQRAMSYEVYEERLLRINQLGRQPGESDIFDTDLWASELRESVFQEGAEGERDLPLLNWGPFTVLDSGSLRMDLARAFDLEESSSRRPQIAGEEERPRFIAAQNFRFDTRVRVKLDPEEVLDHDGDLTWLVPRYGVTVRMDWLSGVLGRELVSAEMEAQVDRDGDFAFAINLLVDSSD